MAKKTGPEKKRGSAQARRSQACVGIQAALGVKIRRLRERKGWTQEMLAHEGGLHSHHLGKIERGQANLCLSTLLEIATGLDTSVAVLFRGVLPK